MGLDSIAAVQTRIDAIQRQFAGSHSTATAAAAPNPRGDGRDFSALLAQIESAGGALGSAGSGTTETAGGAGGVTGLGTSLLDTGFGRVATGAQLPTSQSARTFLDAALSQSGKPYVMGAEAALDDPDPATLDCSELVEWAAHRAGVQVTDGSWLQYLEAKEQGNLVPVEQALRTPGALLFSFSEEPRRGGGRPEQAHVAISLGDGRTIEARGRSYGVGSFEAGDRFEYAAVLPGLT